MNTDTEAPQAGRSLWLWVAGGFLLLALAWTTMLIVAGSAHVESVPVGTPKEARP
jgi:hypothetical protein